MMAAAAKYRDDIAGVTTGGTATAYTVASTRHSMRWQYGRQDHRYGAACDQRRRAGDAERRRTGARALRSSPGVELAAGTLISGTPYVARYVNSAAEWIMALLRR